MLLVKFTENTERVKSISFHPSRPWVLTALYSGIIQLWDYRLQITMQTFAGHDGPVRAVQFHPRLPLLCSGGDDQTVRVWNYKTRTEPFLLKGHLDYVRCVGFHAEFPWVISSSDDQTSRIWNYQSRQMIAILTGHSHYVMCCQFHPDPNQYLIITCSLDKTARLWSYAPLRQKFAGNKKQDLPISGAEIIQVSQMTGHSDQLNWCVFHPNKNIIATAADDKTIILWTYNKDNKCIQDATLRGHTGNVNSVAFHQHIPDILISVSEDMSVRIWDITSKIELITYLSPEKDRYWMVATHSANHYIACGSDSRLSVLTLVKDRVPSTLVQQDYLCYAIRKEIKVIDLRTKNHTLIKDIQDLAFISKNKLKDLISSLNYNIYETSKTQLLVSLQAETKNKKTTFITLSINPRDPRDTTTRTFIALSAAFTGRSKIIRVNPDKQLETYNFENDTSNELGLQATNVLNAPGGKVFQIIKLYFYNKALVINTDDIIIYEPLQRTVQAKTKNELNIVKDCAWGDNFVAIIGKKSIFIYTKSLVKISFWNESIPIKSAFWVKVDGGHEILIYTTKSHIKYALFSGESGVIRSTENIIYIKKITQKDKYLYNVIGVDNSAQFYDETLNFTESILKQALYDKNVQGIKQHLSQLKDHQGDAIVAYLYKKKFPSLAIGMIQDLNARFQLAISSHNLIEAFNTCCQIKSPEAYVQLGQEAMRLGNQQALEHSYSEGKQHSQLGFLYSLLGRTDKQSHLQQMCAGNNQYNALRIQCQVYQGDIVDRVRLLCETGQFPLAYLTAVTNGLNEYANEIQGLIKVNDMSQIQKSLQFIQSQQPQALVPLTPIVKPESNSPLIKLNWPHNLISADQLVELEGTDEQKKLDAEIQKYNQQNNVLLGLQSTMKPKEIPIVQQQEEVQVEEANQEWGIDEDITQPEVITEQVRIENKSIDFHHFQYGVDEKFYKEESQIASKRLLVGDIEGCFKILQSQIALSNPSPLKETVQSILTSSQFLLPQIPFLNSTPLQLVDQNNAPFQAVVNLETLRTLQKQGYKTTTEGKFQDTLNTFLNIVKQSPLVSVTSAEEEKEYKEIIEISLNYILAMRCELGKKKITNNNARVLELGCYMALCNLQTQHRTLTLRSAMSLAYKLKNYITATWLAKVLLKILQKAPEGAAWAKPDVVQNTNKLLQQCEKLATNELKINLEEDWLYDDKFYKRISSSTLQVIDGQILKSSLVSASYESQFKGQLCQISNMTEIGKDCVGLKLR